MGQKIISCHHHEAKNKAAAFFTIFRDILCPLTYTHINALWASIQGIVSQKLCFLSLIICSSSISYGCSRGKGAKQMEHICGLLVSSTNFLILNMMLCTILRGNFRGKNTFMNFSVWEPPVKVSSQNFGPVTPVYIMACLAFGKTFLHEMLTFYLSLKVLSFKSFHFAT